jgi:hypothetical protein
MTRWSFLSLLLFCPQPCFAQQPAGNSEAAMVGLRGPVHTVLTESFDYRDNPHGKLNRPVATLTGSFRLCDSPVESQIRQNLALSA